MMLNGGIDMRRFLYLLLAVCLLAMMPSFAESVAVDYHEHGVHYNGVHVFVKHRTDGVGTSGRMPADEDKNGEVTLYELYNYIKYSWQQ